MPDLALLPKGTRVFVDTNIFYEHFRGRSVMCSAFVSRISSGEITAYVNTQVLSDLIHKMMLAEAYHKNYITKATAVKLKKALATDRTLATNLTDYQTNFEDILDIGIKVLRITRKLLVDTEEERRDHGLMTGDSLHLGSMNRQNTPISDIATNDGDFTHIPEITVWKPMDIVT